MMVPTKVMGVKSFTFCYFFILKAKPWIEDEFSKRATKTNNLLNQEPRAEDITKKIISKILTAEKAKWKRKRSMSSESYHQGLAK